MSCQCDDRNGARDRIALEVASGSPPIHYRQAHVEQDEIGWITSCCVNARLTIGGNNEVIPTFPEATRQHVAVHLVVFYQQDLCHCTA